MQIFANQPGPLIWLHAVSLGEAKAATGLINRLQMHYPSARLVLTASTKTGGAVLQRMCKGCSNMLALYLPLDLPRYVRPLVSALRPNLVLFVEGDIWLHFLQQVCSFDAFVAVVSAKISTRSYRRLVQFRWCLATYWSCIDLVCAQSDRQMLRVENLGFPKAKLSVGGNIKLDNDPPPVDIEFSSALRSQMKCTGSDFIVVIASTHANEERFILQACQPMLKLFPQLHLLIAPRHPERFDSVAELLETFGPITRWSKRAQNTSRDVRIHLVDQLGHLIDCYRLGRFAIVGGSFVEGIGGHNIFEPMQVGTPPLFGPFMESQRELFDLAIERGAGLMVTPDALSNAMHRLLTTDQALLRLQLGCKRACSEAHGALDRTWESLRTCGAFECLEKQ